MHRLSGLALLTCVMISTSTASLAQDALATIAELRIAAVGQSRVVMVQKQADGPIVWEWTFLDDQAETEEGPVDSFAVSVIYDCALQTRRALTLETYLDGSFVSASPMYEEPSAVVTGSLAHGALQVICEPESNMDGAAFPDMMSARLAMDARQTSGNSRPPQAAGDGSGGL